MFHSIGLWIGQIGAWLFANGATIISIIASGLISLVVSAHYYGKGNREMLQMTVLYPAVNLVKEHYSKANYEKLSELSKRYETRYLKKDEKDALIQMLSAYREIKDYKLVEMKASILRAYFEYVLGKNSIDVKPMPLNYEDEIVDYDYPPDMNYLEHDLEKILTRYDSEIEPEECLQAVIQLYNAYCRDCYGNNGSDLPFFEDYSMDKVFETSIINKRWDNRFSAMEIATKKFMELKVIKKFLLNKDNI